MSNYFRRAVTHPMLAIGSTLLWGIVELVALQRSRTLPRDGNAK